MIANTSGDPKKKVGWVAYVDGAARSLVGAKPFALMYQVAGDRMHRANVQSEVLFANCGSSRPALELIPEASVVDGELDIVIFQPKNPIGLSQAARASRRLGQQRPAPLRAGRRILRLRTKDNSVRYARGTGIQRLPPTPPTRCSSTATSSARRRRSTSASTPADCTSPSRTATPRPSCGPRQGGACAPLTGDDGRMPASPTLVWFRDDLRLADHPALRAAIDRGEPVIGVFLLDEVSPASAPRRRRPLVAASLARRPRRASRGTRIGPRQPRRG